MLLERLYAVVSLVGRVTVVFLRGILSLFKANLKKQITDDVILITGGGRGIGKQLALRLAEHKPKHIVLWGRTEKWLVQTAREVQEKGVNCAYMLCDVRDREQVYSLAKELQAKFGNVTMLINNAGIVFSNTVLNSDPDDIKSTLRTNTLAHIWTTRAFLPAMVASNKGHIVAISSVLGLMGLNGAADYCSSKFAVNGFMDSLRDELKSSGVSGVTVTTVYPYHVDNEMFAGASIRFPKLFPAIDEVYLGAKIVDSVLRGEETLIVPWVFCLSAFIYRIAPVAAIIAIMKFIGGDKVMATVKKSKSVNKNHL